ncbi:MAG: carboxypeptidase-like regulatory domain-containing protein [bacterium]|nr:carboxypeptidase-like regulatory domain-containing protein [bacterium]
MMHRRSSAILATVAVLVTVAVVLSWIVGAGAADDSAPVFRDSSGRPVADDSVPATAGAAKAPGVAESWRDAARVEAVADLVPPAARGRVLLAGEPLAYAELGVWRNHGTIHAERVAKLRADEAGEFVVRGVPAASYGLTVAAPGVPLGFVVRHRAVPADRVGEWGDLHCPAAASVVGRVRAEGGRGVPGVRVFRAQRPYTSTPSFARTVRELDAPDADPSVVTDEYGRFRFDGLLPGDHRFLAESSEFYDAIGAARLEPGQRVELPDLVLRRGRTVQGRVIDATGAAIVGAHVAPVGSEGGTQLRRGVSTNAEGAFTVTGVAPFSAKLDVVAAGYGPVLVPVDRRGPMTVQLAPACTIRGRVTGAEGRAVKLDLSPADYTGIGHFAFRRLRGPHAVAVDGSFEIAGLAAREYEIEAEVEGFGRSEELKFTLTSDSPPIELAVQAAPTIEVEVVDAAGMPIEGARVYVDDGPKYSAERYDDPEYLLERVKAARRFKHQLAGTTDSNGRVIARCEAAVKHLVAAVHGRYRPAGAVADAPASEIVRVVLSPAGRITGRLADPESTSWFSVSVACWPITAAGVVPDRPRTHSVDRAGQFAIGELTPGRYGLALSRFGMTWNDESRRSMPGIRPLLGAGVDAREVVEVDVRAGEPTSVVVPVPAIAEIRGRVLRAGVPVADAVVFGMPADPPKNGIGALSSALRDRDHESAFQFSPNLRTDAAGRFRFAVASTGRYHLLCRDREALVAASPVEVVLHDLGHDVEQDLVLGGATIRGQFDLGNLFPARIRDGVVLLLLRAERGVGDPFYSTDWVPSTALGMKTMKLDRAGRFELVGLPAGEWVLRLTNGLSSVHWHGAVRTEPDLVTDLGTIMVTKGREVALRVEAPPVPEPQNESWETHWGAWIRRVPGRGRPYWVATVVIRERLEVVNLVPGTYEVQRIGPVVLGWDWTRGITGDPVGEPLRFEVRSDGAVTPDVLDFR